ncbi:MAG: hypothetical protein R3D62_08230 [Xanthobacteraceae bacterium]
MPHDARAPAHETPQVRARAVLLTVAGLFLLVAGSLAGLYFYFGWVVHGSTHPPASAFPAPQLQTDPGADLRRLEAAQRARLSDYAWIDRSRGIIRVPIERAMALIAARGKDAYAPLEASASAAAASTRPDGSGAGSAR